MYLSIYLYRAYLGGKGVALATTALPTEASSFSSGIRSW